MISVNMKQMNKWVVTQDNVRFYDSIVRTKGKVVSLDYRPYIDLLNDFGIFYTVRQV